MSKNKKIGNLGEEFAKDFYLKKGYDFIDKNWQKKYGEIDLICQKDNEIVFVEVKTRTSLAFGYGEEAVTFSKKNKLPLFRDNKTSSKQFTKPLFFCPIFLELNTTEL